MCIRLNFHAAFTPCDGTYEIIAFALVPLPSLKKLPQHKMMKSCPFNPFATSFGASSDVAGADLSHACRELTQVCVASIAVFHEYLGTFSTPCLDTRDPQCVVLLSEFTLIPDYIR